MIIHASYDRHLIFLNAEGKRIPFKIIGFDVDEKSNIKPLTYPVPPKGAALFAVEDGGYRKFDLATGIATGPASISPEV